MIEGFNFSPLSWKCNVPDAYVSFTLRSINRMITQMIKYTKMKIYGNQKHKLSPYFSGITFMTSTLDRLPMDHINIMTPILVGLVMDLITMDPYI